ncbi:MAG: hypothetical protein L3J29_02480 [Cyclobacteriaceae bacterium]|nr:hypothetical protein [Cyclobacteriaceae bacterium]
MIRTFFLFNLLLISSLAWSQTDIVITLKGDSLTGKVSIAGNRGNAIQTIILKNGKNKVKFKVYEVKSLLKGDNIYHTRKINGKYQLGLLVKEGYLSIYKIMGSESTSSNEFSDRVLLKLDGTYLVVPNIGFKKYMNTYLGDCPTVSEGFEDDIYKKSDLDKIVDDYNNCIADNTKKTNDKKPEVSLNSGKVKQIEELISAIKEDGNLPDIDTVLEMLNDLKGKLKEGAKVPGYLVNALQDSLKTSVDFTQQLAQILE